MLPPIGKTKPAGIKIFYVGATIASRRDCLNSSLHAIVHPKYLLHIHHTPEDKLPTE